MFRTADVSTCGRRFFLCIIWVYHWNRGHSYSCSRWISWLILHFHGDTLYNGRSHCTHQLHIVCCFILPPPILHHCYNRGSTIPVDTPQPWLGLRSFIQHFIRSFLLPLFFLVGCSSIISLTSIMSASISLPTRYLLPLSAILSIDWLLCWIDTARFLLVLCGLDSWPSVSFCAFPTPLSLPVSTCQCTLGTPPFRIAYCFFSQIHHSVVETQFWFPPS